MNTITSPSKGDADSRTAPEEGTQESIYPYHAEKNITDGGEFLDDAIRMKDQPIEKTDKKKTNKQQASYRHLF